MTLIVGTLVIIVALLSVLVVGLLRSHAEIVRALHDLGVNLDPDAPDGTFRATASEPGAIRRPMVSDVGPASTVDGVLAPTSGRLVVAHDLAGATPDGGAAVVSMSGRPGLTLVAFLSTGCGTCADFWSAFRTAPTIGGSPVRLIIVTHSPAAESPSSVAELAPENGLVVMSDEAFDDHGVAAAPYFVLVDGADASVIGEGSAAGWVQLKALLQRAAADAGWAADRRSRRDLLNAGARRRQVDHALAEAGIFPGDPSLTPEQ